MVTSEIHKRLVENFKLLENKNWVEYEEYIKPSNNSNDPATTFGDVVEIDDTFLD